MVEACLRIPVTSREGCGYGLSFVAHNCVRDNLFYENAIRESESLGVQIEISFGWWIVIGLSFWPRYIGEWGSWYTILLVAKIVVVWRILPYLTIIWLGRTANISRRATP